MRLYYVSKWLHGIFGRVKYLSETRAGFRTKVSVKLILVGVLDLLKYSGETETGLNSEG